MKIKFIVSPQNNSGNAQTHPLLIAELKISVLKGSSRKLHFGTP